MTGTFALPKKLVVFGVVLPLAVFLGYLLATPEDFTTFSVVITLLIVLLFPIFMRWHHPLLIFSWNAAVQVFFLPGQPQLWMLFAGVSLLFTVLNRLLLKQESQTYVPSIVWPLIFLTLVVVVTAKFTGGIGLRVLGSGSYGGKRYVYFAAAIIGYFALTGQRIAISKAKLYTGLFFFSYITAAISNLIYVLGPGFWFLYALFPVGYAMSQAIADYTQSDLVRLAGLAEASRGICYFMLCRFGISGLCIVAKPWRLLGFLLAFCVMLLGGFRSSLLALGILFVIQFFLEGLHRTRLLVVMLIAIVLGIALVIPFASKMPFSVQRTLAFLPIEVSPLAKYDALASTEWRVRMWRVLWPEVPKYLFLGKGCSVNPTDLYLVNEALRRGQADNYEGALVAGDYHSGPLTLLITFGLWGCIGFLWFSIASIRVLYKNYRYSPPELEICNKFLFAFFMMHMLGFIFIAGAFPIDLFVFTGIIGLSVSLNGGMRKSSVQEAGSESKSTLAIQPASGTI